MPFVLDKQHARRHTFDPTKIKAGMIFFVRLSHRIIIEFYHSMNEDSTMQLTFYLFPNGFFVLLAVSDNIFV